MGQAVVTKDQTASRFQPVLKEGKKEGEVRMEGKEGGKERGREGERKGGKEGGERERERERDSQTSLLTKNSVSTSALLLMYSTVSLTKMMSK